jgi:hypothetical protein
MSAFVTVVGRILSIEPSKNGDFTNITVNAPTGEKKKEGDKYAPSQRFRFGLNEKMATAIIGRLSLEKGVRVMVRGKLGYPYVYTTESGDQGLIQNLTYDVSVEKIWDDEPRTGDTSEAAPAASNKAKPAAPAKVVEEDEDDIGF